MSYAFEGLSVVATALFGLGGLLLLLARTSRGRSLRDTLTRGLRRAIGHADLAWLRWWHLALGAALFYGVVTGFDVVSGAYACPGGMRESDLIGYLDSGRALLTGGNPFTVPDCGGTIPEPYGIAAILISALGSLGGIPGVAFVWGVVGVALVPLTWAVAGPDRRYLTLFVVSSPLYLPLIATQIDGASNALIPVTVFASLFLMTRSEPVAAALGGFLSTGRFPTVFPLVASFGGRRRRYLGAAIAFGVFAVVTAITYAIWRSEFVDVVFFSQIGRRSFSLNFYGVLQYQNLLPSGSLLPALQALLTVAVVAVAFFRAGSPLRAAAFALTGVAILTQYLSFNMLVSLLPVALVDARSRWWVWGIGIVGAVNYDVAFSDWALNGGVYWPTELLDGLLTLLLVGLLVDLWRSRAAQPSPA
ncbi:MAG TPA: hypothetical protein VMI55_08335 [Thermoplasmata archaeon]|nr:hypothetical protein [Thermoplasmata archaeon]